MLYCYKIKSFREIAALQRDAVWRKIVFILQRIIIITFFYQITSLSLFILRGAYWLFSKDIVLRNTITNILNASLTVLYSISMYLMLEHNTDEYLGFLRCFKRSYLKYICFCCCHRIVDEQLKDFESIKKEKESEKASERTRKLTLTSTEFPTVKYSTRDRGLSSPTETIISTGSPTMTNRAIRSPKLRTDLSTVQE